MKTCGLLEESSNFIWENLKNSRSKLQYMLLFSLAPIFGNVKLTFGAGSTTLFGMNGIYTMGISGRSSLTALFDKSTQRQSAEKNNLQ